MKKTKILSLILAMLLLLSSCSATTPDVTEADTQTEAAVNETAPETETEILPDLPEGMDLEGKTIAMLIKEADTVGDIEGDELSVAAYNTQVAVEELLNFKCQFDISSSVPNQITNLVRADEDAYAAAAHSGRWFAATFLSGIFMDIADLEYVNLDKPWWYKDYIEGVSVNINRPNVLISDMTYYPVGLLQCVLMNERLLNQYIGMTNEELYQLVMEGKWTTDMFLSFTENVYTDTNGDGTYDDGDIYPFMSQEFYSVSPFIYGSGLSMESRDSEGYLVIDVNNELVFNQVDKMFNLFNSPICRFTMENNTQTYFAAGQILMIQARLADTFWYIRDMEDDYCIIPLPKYDETLPTYYTFPNGSIQWYGVPTTVSDTESVSAALEALSYYGNQFIKPTIIEQSMKTKYSRDAMASQVIDILIESTTASFMYAYEKSGKVGKIPELFENIFNPKNTTNQFASYAASFEQSTLTALEKIKEDMQ